MQRVTLRVPKQQLDEVDHLVDTGEFPNRSEAIRSMVRVYLHDHDRGRREEEPSWTPV